MSDGSEPPLARSRHQAKHRQRRLIHNNDGDDLSRPGADTREGFLTHRCHPLLNTQVDTLCYGTGVTTLFHHNTEVGETLDSWPLDGSERDPYVRNQKALRAAGLDSLNLVVDFAREHELEVFWSHRMNDVHDSAADHEWFTARHKLDHPELLMGTVADREATEMESPRWWWSAYDYDKPEVLDHLCNIQAEVCAQYDVDGIECDYFRNPMFFRSNLDFAPATAAQVAAMTGFQQRLRSVHLEASSDRGRPILTAARVPLTEERCLYAGIDVRTWLDQGLVDLIFVSGGYLPFTEPIAELLTLARSKDVPAFASMNTPLLTRSTDRPLESIRGAAQNCWHAGAHGLQLFNCFDGWYNRDWVSDIGSPETLVGKDKVFAIDSRGWTKGGYRAMIIQDHGVPIEIAGGTPREISLCVGDDLPAAEETSSIAAVELMIRLADRGLVDSTEVALNGHDLVAVDRDTDTGELRFYPGGSQFVHGANDLLLLTVAATSATAVEVYVRYK